MSESLKDKTLRGVGWSFGGSLANYGITFVVGIILARLLSPSEYGIIGIITIFITIFNGIIDGGLTNALIRKQQANEEDNNTVFYSNIVIAIAMFFALYYIAKPISVFFGDPRLIEITRVMGVCLLINALSIIHIALLTKELDFKTQTKCNIISSLISGFVGITMAISNCGVWALVGQQISQKLFYTILLWVLRNWRPKLLFSWRSFKDLFGFGWKLMLSGIISSLWGQLYQVVIGKFYTTEMLGQYTKAKEYSNLVSTNLTSVIQKVSYPTLSKIQDDKEKLARGYRLILRMSAYVTFVFTLGLAGCAHNFIYVLIGEQWLPCVPMMQIICFSMAFYPVQSINLNLLQVQGRSDLFLKLELIKKVIGILPLLAGIFINIYCMLIVGFFTGGCIDFILNSYYSGKFISYSTKDQMKDLMPSAFISLSMAVLVYCIGLFQMNECLELFIQISFGAIYTILISEKFKYPEYVEIKRIFKNINDKIIARYG